MGMQQLDLFATFNAPAAVEKQAEIEVVATVEQKVEAPEIITEEKPIEESVTKTVDSSIVFTDENIAVKIKPKVSVQLPKEQPKPFIVAKQSSAVVKAKSKRGRKSYKEIDAELDLVEVPDEDVLKQKMYYSITEVAKWFKVNASLLRYWENEFDILKPRKNRKGDRLFRPEDIKNLQIIYYLLRNRKFSLEGAKKYLRNNRQQADVNVQLTQSLTKFRSFLLELKVNLGS